MNIPLKIPMNIGIAGPSTRELRHSIHCCECRGNVAALIQRCVARHAPSSNGTIPDKNSSNDTEETDGDILVVPERYSIAFVCNAYKETLLECLPVCQGPDQPPKYEPMQAFAYLTSRLAYTIPMAPSTGEEPAPRSIAWNWKRG
jgi:hypothetical protein